MSIFLAKTCSERDRTKNRFIRSLEILFHRTLFHIEVYYAHAQGLVLAKILFFLLMNGLHVLQRFRIPRATNLLMFLGKTLGI